MSQQTKATMTDPFALWKQMYDNNEEAVSQAFHQFLSTEAFAAIMGRSLDSHVSMQEVFKQVMETYSSHLPWPTQDDIVRLHRLVQNVEAKMDDIEGQIEVLAMHMAHVGEKMDLLLNHGKKGEDDKE